MRIASEITCCHINSGNVYFIHLGLEEGTDWQKQKCEWRCIITTGM